MAFDPETFFPPFEAGEQVLVPETDLTAMEDALLQMRLPQQPTTPNQQKTMEGALSVWHHRTRLVEEIRGKKFNGRLLAPQVELQESAVALESLLAHRRNILGNHPESRLNDVLGITITSPISSTRADVTGAISKDVWYVRTVPGSSTYNSGKLWLRNIGNNKAENTIEESLRRSRSAAPGSSHSRSGKTTSHRRP